MRNIHNAQPQLEGSRIFTHHTDENSCDKREYSKDEIKRLVSARAMHHPSDIKHRLTDCHQPGLREDKPCENRAH